MAIIGRHVATSPPYYGLPPEVVNIPSYVVVAPKASGTAALKTTTFASGGGTCAVGTQADVARNAVVHVTPNTASSTVLSGGHIKLYGWDMQGSTRSESFAITDLASHSDGTKSGLVNFQAIGTISILGSYLAAKTDSATKFTFNIGLGQKLGMPVSFQSTNAVFQVSVGTLAQSTSSGANSTNNQWTVVTGDYHLGGVKVSGAYSTNSAIAVGYYNIGYAGPPYHG